MAFLKPQSPMTKGSDYFYPLTTADQVIMDGGYRLDEIVSKTKKSTIVLYANGWSTEAPYCYSIAVKGLSDKVNMKMLPHFPEDFEGKQAMKEETAKISFATREGNILTFECWDGIPTIDLPIDIEIDVTYPIKGSSIKMNYSVVGGVEEPAEPTENMIWVNTDQDITDWVFSKNEPKNPKEGMIWFITGIGGVVSFFTLTMDGKEFDEIYPISAKQYVSNSWVDHTTKSYQNNKWVAWWDGTLYEYGDEYYNITGGWISVTNFGTFEVTKETDHIYCVAEEGSSGAGGYIRTKNKIPISFSTLTLVYDATRIATDTVLCLSENADLSNTICEVSLGKGTELTAQLDISDIVGEYYVGIIQYTNSGNTTVTVYSLKLT